MREHMVLIFDGHLETDAHAGGKFGNLIWLRRLFRPRAYRIWDFFLSLRKKPYFFLHASATCSAWPSTVGNEKCFWKKIITDITKNARKYTYKNAGVCWGWTGAWLMLPWRPCLRTHAPSLQATAGKNTAPQLYCAPNLIYLYQNDWKGSYFFLLLFS